MKLHTAAGRSSFGRPHVSIERTFPLICQEDPALAPPADLPDSDDRIKPESVAKLRPEDLRRLIGDYARLDLYRQYVKNTEDESALCFVDGMAPVRYHFRCFTPPEEVKHRDIVASLEDTDKARYDHDLDVLCTTVKRVDNWPSDYPEPKIVKGYVSRETFMMLPPDHVTALAGVISNYQSLTDHEKKASSSLPSDGS